jgi:hypothetical protein
MARVLAAVERGIQKRFLAPPNACVEEMQFCMRDTPSAASW